MLLWPCLKLGKKLTNRRQALKMLEVCSKKKGLRRLKVFRMRPFGPGVEFLPCLDDAMLSSIDTGAVRI